MFNSIISETSFVKSFGETKLPSSFLNTNTFTSVYCEGRRQNSTIAFHQINKTKKLYLLPLFKLFLRKFTKMIQTQNYSNKLKLAGTASTTAGTASSKLIYKLDLLRNKKRNYQENNKKSENLFNLNLETIYIIFCLNNDKYELVLNDIENQQRKMETGTNNNCNCLKKLFKNESKFDKSGEPHMTDFVIQNFMFINEMKKKHKQLEKVNNQSTAEKEFNTKEMRINPVNENIDCDDDDDDSSILNSVSNNKKMKMNEVINERNNNSSNIDVRFNIQPPLTRRRKKRKKKNRLLLKCSLTNVQGNFEKFNIDSKQKRKRKKLKKRQRNQDRDEKKELFKFNDLCETNNMKNKLNCCSTLQNGLNNATVCISLKTLPPSSPLPSHFTFPPRTNRERQISECSNDSFEICFVDDYNDDDYDNDSDSSYTSKKISNDFNDSDDTDSDSGLLDERKVRFNLKPKVHVIRHWDFAHRQARKGKWEEIARDRVRFHDRIKQMETILSPILDTEHRQNIFYKRFM